MKLRTGFAVLVTGVLLQVMSLPAQAQVITEGPDSTVVTTTPAPVVATPVDTSGRTTGFLSTWDKPARAAVYSAVLPGLGQVYNGAWWKVPIIYATGGVLGYFLIDNNRKYQASREALLIRLDGDSTTVDAFENNTKYPNYGEYYLNGSPNPNGTRNLRRYRDYYRRNRDLTILISILAWGMQVAEAHIHAHMKDFDVSDDLALQIKPNLIRTPATALYAPGITFTLYTKAK